MGLYLRRLAPWRRVELQAFLLPRGYDGFKEPANGPIANIDDDALAVIDDTSRIALILHHEVLDVEHITAALLRLNGTTARVTRILTRRDPRHSEAPAFMIERGNQD